MAAGRGVEKKVGISLAGNIQRAAQREAIAASGSTSTMSPPGVHRQVRRTHVPARTCAWQLDRGREAPAYVVRLGYLYGPASADLRAYRTAFRLGRPYWAESARALQYHLHQLDAGAALLGAARPQNAGKVLYATDGAAVSFRRLMDAFARRVGRPRPLHLPLWSKQLARLIIDEQHMQQVALNMPLRSPSPRVPGWKPRFPDFDQGLDQVIQAWSSQAEVAAARSPDRD